MEYEFVNPAYHSFKDYISVSAYNRIQWAGKIEYSPKTYASNMYIPFIPGRLGGSLNVMVEDLGLRRMTDVKLGFCHNILLFAGKHLSVGYSAGIIQDHYMMDRIRYYPDEDMSFLATDYTYASVAVGFFYWSDRTYLSLSSIASHLKSNMVSSDYLPGLDFSAGHLFLLSPFVKMMPTFSFKYLNWDAVNKAQLQKQPTNNLRFGGECTAGYPGMDWHELPSEIRADIYLRPAFFETYPHGLYLRDGYWQRLEPVRLAQCQSDNFSWHT